MVPLRCTNAPFHFSSVHFTTNHFYIKVLQLATLQPSLICSIFFATPAVSPALKTKTHAKTSTTQLHHSRRTSPVETLYHLTHPPVTVVPRISFRASPKNQKTSAVSLIKP